MMMMMLFLLLLSCHSLPALIFFVRKKLFKLEPLLEPQLFFLDQAEFHITETRIGAQAHTETETQTPIETCLSLALFPSQIYFSSFYSRAGSSERVRVGSMSDMSLKRNENHHRQHTIPSLGLPFSVSGLFGRKKGAEAEILA